MDTTEYDDIKVFLTHGIFPTSFQGPGRALVNKRQHYKKRSEIFYIKDDVLYKRVQKSLKGVTVVKNGASDAILREFHSSAIGGHSGFNKTNSAIRLRYWWPRMTVDIRKFVKLCIPCQMSDPMKPAKNPDLQQIHADFVRISKKKAEYAIKVREMNGIQGAKDTQLSG